MEHRVTLALVILLKVAIGNADVRQHGQTLSHAFPAQHSAPNGHPTQHAAGGQHPSQHGAGGQHPAQHGAGVQHPSQHGAGGQHPSQHGAVGQHPAQHTAGGHHPSQHGGGGHHPAQHTAARQGRDGHLGGGYDAPATDPEHKSGLCTDVSYVKPVVYSPGEICCTTKVIEPFCEESVVEVNKEVTETVCELIPTPMCSMKDCPVDVTYPEQYEKEFEPWACELRPKTLYHHKTLPVCHNVSKPICIEEWKTDYTTGQRYKVKTDKCEDAYWEECEDQTKKVPFQTMESQCWKDKGIWYESCKEVTTPVNMMCWSCEADAAEKCYQKTSIKTISVPTKRCEPRTESSCNPAKKVPSQERVHQEKCLHHDKEGNMVHEPPAYHAPAPAYSAPTSYAG